MIRWMIESANIILGRLRSRQIISAGPGLIKVNLGCGLAIAPGWINIDGSMNALLSKLPRWLIKIGYRLSGANRYFQVDEYCRLLKDNRFIHHDLTFGTPFRPESVDYYYTSHFIEHLYIDDAKYLLRTCFTSLRSGGRIRISIPDLEYAIGLYGKGEVDKMLTNYFFVHDKSSHYAAHKYMYNFAMMRDVLRDIGFNDITKLSFRAGEVPDLVILDNRPEDSLFIEAVK